jgi:hypothetical protein
VHSMVRPIRVSFGSFPFVLSIEFLLASSTG